MGAVSRISKHFSPCRYTLYSADIGVTICVSAKNNSSGNSSPFILLYKGKGIDWIGQIRAGCHMIGKSFKSARVRDNKIAEF